MCKTEEHKRLVDALKAKLFSKRGSRPQVLIQGNCSPRTQFSAFPENNPKKSNQLPFSSSMSQVGKPNMDKLIHRRSQHDRNNGKMEILPAGATWGREDRVTWPPQENRFVDEREVSLVGATKKCSWPALDLSFHHQCNNPLREVLGRNNKRSSNVQPDAAPPSPWAPLPSLEGQYGNYEIDWVSGGDIGWDSSELYCVVPSVLGQ